MRSPTPPTPSPFWQGPQPGTFRYNQTTGEAEGNPREYVEKGVLLRECSGGQKHLIYVLRELAARRPILLCDELICGLDADRQARVMSMLRERRAETAVLFITTDLHSLAVMCSEPQDQGAPESLGCTQAPHCLLSATLSGCCAQSCTCTRVRSWSAAAAAWAAAR